MPHHKKQVSKQERKIWHKKPAHMIGQGLYTGGMIGFVICVAGLDTDIRFKIFLGICFFAATIGMALIQGCIEDHYLERITKNKKQTDPVKENIKKLID